MRFLGGVIVLMFIVLGMMCIWASCEGAWEMITVGAASHAELVCNWFMIAVVFLCGVLFFATAPIIINEL